MAKRHLHCVAIFLALLTARRLGSAPSARGDEIRPFRWEETLDVNALSHELQSRIVRAPHEPNDFDLRTNICMSAYAVWRLGKDADETRRLQLAKIVLKYAKEAVVLKPEHAAGHHWIAVGIGMVGVTRGVLNSLQLVPQVQSEFELSARLDPDYLYASATSQLGRLYSVLPGFPVSIGDRRKALELLLLARKRAPDESLPILYLADLYWLTGHDEKALEAIATMLALKPKNEFQYFSYHVCKRKALEMRGMIERHDPRPLLFDVTHDFKLGLVR